MTPSRGAGKRGGSIIHIPRYRLPAERPRVVNLAAAQDPRADVPNLAVARLRLPRADHPAPPRAQREPARAGPARRRRAGHRSRTQACGSPARVSLHLPSPRRATRGFPEALEARVCHAQARRPARPRSTSERCEAPLPARVSTRTPSWPSPATARPRCCAATTSSRSTTSGRRQRKEAPTARLWLGDASRRSENPQSRPLGAGVAALVER